jgi:ribosome-associated protein
LTTEEHRRPATPEEEAVGSREAAVAAARAAADKQAEDIAILDVHDLIVITDFFVICSGSSDRQVKSVVEEVEEALRALGLRPVRREGEQESRWVLLDYVDVVVHVFADEERAYYDLERLWADAPRVDWRDGGVAASAGSLD